MCKVTLELKVRFFQIESLSLLSETTSSMESPHLLPPSNSLHTSMHFKPLARQLQVRI